MDKTYGIVIKEMKQYIQHFGINLPDNTSYLS